MTEHWRLGYSRISGKTEKKSRDIPLKGDLDAHKKSFVENKNLSKIWDFLDLYDNKMLIKTKKESQKLRASRMEAVFGIIYLEGGVGSRGKSNSQPEM